MRASFLALASWLALLALASSAVAHSAGLSHGDYRWQDGRLLAAVSFARSDLIDKLPWLVDREGRKSLVAFEDQRARLGAWLGDGLDVETDGARCSPTFDAMRFDGDGIAFAIAYACPGQARTLTVATRFLIDLDANHRHVATVQVDDRSASFVTSVDHPSFAFAVAPAATAQETDHQASNGGAGFSSFLGMGIAHILTGYDHLLFLLGLVLVGGPLRSLALAVTAFTVSHSITLALAALDVWTPSTRIVEPCIALSIAYIGVENWFVDSAAGRFKITFPFGLVHGFGFASALRAVAIPRPQIPLALFGFNLGVEIGQLGVVALLLPLVLLVRKREAPRRPATRACTVAVALAGAVWFVIRVKDSMG